MNSSISSYEPPFILGLYGMTKAVLNNMAKWMKEELREDGIRVNCIAPGMIETEMTVPGIRSKNVNFPEDSIGKAEQIGSVSAMICSDDGSFINGETLLVNGGYRSFQKL